MGLGAAWQASTDILLQMRASSRSVSLAKQGDHVAGCPTCFSRILSICRPDQCASNADPLLGKQLRSRQAATFCILILVKHPKQQGICRNACSCSFIITNKRPWFTPALIKGGIHKRISPCDFLAAAPYQYAAGTKKPVSLTTIAAVPLPLFTLCSVFLAGH